MISLSIPEMDSQLRPRITVVGVGGAGGNAINNMIQSNLEGVEFLAANTDAQALNGSLADRKLQLGIGITQGLGAGARPDVGRAAAEEVIEEILRYLEGSHMVFITAGMGGGTGTGAAPVIARAARDQGILTVGVVTKPFHFEGAHRMKMAEQGINELQQFVDTLIVIPNQNLFRIANEKTTFADAFKMADDVLHSGVRGVTDLMVMPGLINLDFADIRTVMGEMGKAMMGTGEAEGENRSVAAAEAAISNPLLDEVSMKGARGVLINITGGEDVTLYEVDEAANRIRDEVDSDANIIFGSTFDPTMDGRLRVSVVATGIDVEPATMAAPLRSASTMAIARQQRPAPEPVARPAEAAPVMTRQEVEEAPLDEVVEQAVPQAPIPRGHTSNGGAFIAPPPMEAPQRSRPHATVAPHAADPFGNAAGHAHTENEGPRRRNLFQAVTGLPKQLRDGLTAHHEEAAPAPVQRPAASTRPTEPVQQKPAVQPRLDVNPRGPLPRADLEDTLEIPAFLRRQAN